MAYTPDITRYQQLVYGGATGAYDCTAWCGAIITDAHTRGGTKLSGRLIRISTDEPIPDPTSPGLNLPQVDAAIYKLTSGRVNLDTRVGYSSLSREGVKSRIVDGRWATVQVRRGVLVDRGFLSGFRGSHAITVHARAIDNSPVIGDPLVSHYVVASWDAIFDAAQSLTGGWVYTQMTRDLTPDYKARVPPGRFFRYFLNSRGTITRRESTRTDGFGATCTPPRYHPGVYARQLVQLTSGSRKGWWISADYAREV